MLWQIIDIDENPNGSEQLETTFDDGLPYLPGDAGFTTEHIVAYAGIGNFNYMGTPNWLPPEGR